VEVDSTPKIVGQWQVAFHYPTDDWLESADRKRRHTNAGIYYSRQSNPPLTSNDSQTTCSRQR